MVWGGIQIWIYYVQIQYSLTLKYNLLAIDIPRGNDLSPRAVENMFTYFAGTHKTYSLIEKYWLGMYQLAFTFEIVSIEGYTQFLIWTPAEHRNLTESAVYSQYPDAEITEVNDYTADIPIKYPDDEWEIYGGEFIPAKHWAFPIKTWEEFEHAFGKPETHFKDPMASLMDLCSSLGAGEQLWYQLIIYPTGFDWPDEGEKQISKVIGEKVATKKMFLDNIIDTIMNWIWVISELIYKLGGDSKKDEKAEDDNRFLMMNLKPKQKKQIESIQRKSSKLGFQCKIRFIYVSKKEVHNKGKVAGGFIGFMKQFMDLDTNNLKPDMDMTFTSTDYFFEKLRKDAKKIRIMSGYKSRSGTRGRKRFILNVEELATIWHFPVEAVVRAPLIQKAPGRKSEPPIELPVDERPEREYLFDATKENEEDIIGDDDIEKESENSNKKINNKSDEDDSIFDDAPSNIPKEKKGEPPSNLPFA